MAASTYTQKANLAVRGAIKSVCASTVYVAESTLDQGMLSLSTTPMSAANGMGIPGAIKSTIVGDIMRFPVQKEDSKMVFYVIADSIVTASSNSYLQMAIRLPTHASTLQDYSPAWGVSGTVGTSTVESGWKLIKTTAALLATSSEAEAFIAGPFESNRYAMNFGATSTSGIDKNQNYFELTLQLSSVLSTGTYLKNTTNVFTGTAGAFYVIPIEIP